MLIKTFTSRETFYRFLKDRIGIFVKEAEERSFEGVFHCIYIRFGGDPQPLFLSARKNCLSVFSREDRFALCGSESSIRKFCSDLTDYPETKALAREILENLIKFRRQSFQIRYNRKVLPLGLKTALMGILNVTPDSFSDGGLYTEPESSLKRAVEMVEEGADIIDIGGESTRPGSERISSEEELRRVLPVLKLIRKELPDIWISVDTYKSDVARACLEEGADMINDVSGGTWDGEMHRLIAERGCPYVINHVKGTPATWKTDPPVYDDVIEEIKEWLSRQISRLKDIGLKDGDNLIVDPGIGFGKLPEHNIEIINRLRELRILGRPILIGVSRKSFIGAVIEAFLGKKSKPEERLGGSLGATACAVLEGASIVRTHDVAQTREFLALLDAVRTMNAV